MPLPSQLADVYPRIVDRVLATGCVDPSILSEPNYAHLTRDDLREAAVDALSYVARIGRPTRTIESEEYYLVMQLALRVGILGGLYAGALSGEERSKVTELLVDVLGPTASWVKQDLQSGPYRSVSGVWPFSALLATLSVNGR